MFLTIGIDNNNDIYLDSNGNIVLKSDLEAMGDIYVNKVQTNKGGLYYNTEKGVDYFNTIFGEPCYLDLFQNDVINQLKDTENTIKVNQYTPKINNEVYSYSVNCQTNFGAVTLNG